jgi:FkbM family methyltransferase
LKDVLTALRINCVLDVGANKGQFAASLRDIGYEGDITSFEPLRADFQMLEARMHSDPRWRGMNLALGNQDETRTFNVALDSTEMSSFLMPQDRGWNLRRESVEMRKLDSLFPELCALMSQPPRIFLKMDTQGYDVEVVRGAKQSLHQIAGIQSELAVSPLYQGMPTYLQALELYQECGFALMSLAEASRAPQDNRLLELNCVMVRLSELAPHPAN